MPDIVLWGTEQIGRAAGILDAHGNVDLRKTFYLLENGRLPAKKVGRKWQSLASAIERALAIDPV